MFFANYSPPLVGKAPTFISIDGGVDQTTDQSFNYNGESDLDLEYAMALVYPQQVTLYQVGDTVESASFNNFLDALDGSYCTYQGGDDPTQDSVYPDPNPGGYKGKNIYHYLKWLSLIFFRRRELWWRSSHKGNLNFIRIQ